MSYHLQDIAILVPLLASTLSKTAVLVLLVICKIARPFGKVFHARVAFKTLATLTPGVTPRMLYKARHQLIVDQKLVTIVEHRTKGNVTVYEINPAVLLAHVPLRWKKLVPKPYRTLHLEVRTPLEVNSSSLQAVNSSSQNPPLRCTPVRNEVNCSSPILYKENQWNINTAARRVFDDTAWSRKGEVTMATIEDLFEVCVSIDQSTRDALGRPADIPSQTMATICESINRCGSEKTIARIQEFFATVGSDGIEGSLDSFTAFVLPDKPAQRSRVEPPGEPSYFLRVFTLYPSKTSRDLALRTWQTLNPDAATVETMIRTLTWQLTDGAYLPSCFHLWLQDRRWEDTRKPPKLSFREQEAARARAQADKEWRQHG